jgi:hypothetical protein
MKHILPVITTARNAIPSNEYKIAASKGKYIENVKGYKLPLSMLIVIILQRAMSNTIFNSYTDIEYG